MGFFLPCFYDIILFVKGVIMPTKKVTVKKEVKTSKTYTNMFEAYKAFWKRGFTEWTGTSSRSEYWWSTLMNMIIFFVLFILLGLCIGPDIDAPLFPLAGSAVIIVLFVLSLAILIPTISLQLRRFHDVGIASWIFWLLFICHLFLVFLFDFSFIGLIVFIISLLPTKKDGNMYHKYNK